MNESRDWVNVIALTTQPAGATDDDPHAVLVEQFRFDTARNAIEVPGGIIGPGEDPLAAGVRELREETGYTSDGFAHVLGVVDANPAIMTNRATTILVEGCRLTHPTGRTSTSRSASSHARSRHCAT